MKGKRAEVKKMERVPCEFKEDEKVCTSCTESFTGCKSGAPTIMRVIDSILMESDLNEQLAPFGYGIEGWVSENVTGPDGEIIHAVRVDITPEEDEKDE